MTTLDTDTGIPKSQRLEEESSKLRKGDTVMACPGSEQGTSDPISHRKDSLRTAQGNHVSTSRPVFLQLPQSQSIARSDARYEESDSDEAPLTEEEIQNTLGVSIGREQSRLLAPTTPAVEKVAALDSDRNWGFFDGTMDDEQEAEKDGSTPYNSQLGTPETPQSSSHIDSSFQKKGPSLPPLTLSSKTFDVSSQKRPVLDGIKRKRAATGPAASLADLGISRFLSSISLSTLSEQLSFKDISLPRIPSILGSSKSEHRTSNTERIGGSESATKKGFSSNALFKRSNSEASPTRQKNFHPDDETISSMQAGGSNTSQSPYEHTCDIRNDQSSMHELAKSPSSIRRAKSEQSLRPSIAMSRISSLGDDSRWEHVHAQVNSRVKAVFDSLQDSSIKLPNLPSLNLNSLLPDSKGKASSENARQANHRNITQENASHVRGAEKYEGTHVAQSQIGMKNTARHSGHRHLENALEELTGDIVVLGGYRGSILRSTVTNQQLWVPLKVGLNMRRVDLEVGLEAKDEEKMEESIFPSGMLTHVGPIDIGRRLLRRLKHSKNATQGRLKVHNYGYDWRLSPALSSCKLIAFLESLECNQKGVFPPLRGATVIAHSLGGLITRHAVNQRPELFAGVVYAGVPQHCVNILGPFRNGDEVLLSAKVLTAQVNFSIRTSFVLLPESGRCFFDKDTKEEYPVNFFDVEDWRKYAFSPCIATPTAVSLPEKKSLLGSFSSALPSFNGMPSFTTKRGTQAANAKDVLASDIKDATAKTADSAASKADDLSQPAKGVLAPNLSSSESPSSSSISTTCTIPLSLALTYLERTLAETLAFKQALAHNPKHAVDNVYPPLAVIYSTSSPTVYGARVSGRDSIRRVDAYDDLAFASGDGVVLARAAMVPEGYVTAKGGRVRTVRGHVGLLGDLESVGKCLLAVIRARRE